MSFRLAAILSCSLLLAGCSSSSAYWDIFNFSGDSGADDATREQQAAAAAPTAVPPPATAPGATPDAFCAGVARQDAGAAPFDPATQQRVAQRSYQQCVAMYRSQ